VFTRSEEPSIDPGNIDYREILERTPLVPWTADAQTWRFTYVGPQAVKLLGYPQEEWYGDNFIAYVVSVLEDEALTRFSSDADAMVAARLRVDAALRSVWPGFYHRNLAPDVRAYFEATFHITASDRRLLANRYIDPILDDTFNVRASPARIVCAARQSSRFGVPAAPAVSTP